MPYTGSALVEQNHDTAGRQLEMRRFFHQLGREHGAVSKQQEQGSNHVKPHPVTPAKAGFQLQPPPGSRRAAMG